MTFMGSIPGIVENGERKAPEWIYKIRSRRTAFTAEEATQYYSGNEAETKGRVVEQVLK
jgi:hypothetical protein